MNNSPKYTALHLLEKVIEFTHMTSDPVEWSYEEQKGNPPRFIRLKQIHSLIDAFIPELMASKDIRQSIENFFVGNFLITRPVMEYFDLTGKIDKAIENSRFSGVHKKKLDVFDLRSNYCNLMDYYLKMKSLINHNNGMMEISYPYMFSYIVTDSVSEALKSKGETISNLLVEFIDPKNQMYTEEELVSLYNYPVLDLLEMDQEWM
ncbi:MAG TPA: hypothetical protein VFG54_13135 [Prolixibacteraceae bacterium]|nr:hypothetical protein [Prolixibacteraceae bacterium]